MRWIYCLLICMLHHLGAEECPHLTPEKLVGVQFSKDTFKGITVAIVGYCPPPSILTNYHPVTTTEQYFIHIPPSSVHICEYQGIRFLSIFHVYGGPVSAALIEELHYYGIQHVLAYGLAGGLGTLDLKMGSLYLVQSALAKDGTTHHYTPDRVISSDDRLNQLILELAATHASIASIKPVMAVTDDAIYREYDSDICDAIQNQCDIINCDSSHLFAVSKKVGISCTECGVVSDVIGDHNKQWDSELANMLSDPSAPGPMDQVNKLVQFYIESVMPKLNDLH